MQEKVSIIVVRYTLKFPSTFETEISVCTSQLWKIFIIKYMHPIFFFFFFFFLIIIIIISFHTNIQTNVN